MKILQNPFRGTGKGPMLPPEVPFPSVDADIAQDLVAGCPVAAETPLTQVPDLARQCDVGEVWIKDERNRMGLGSFKALGAAYVIAHDARQGRAAGATYVTASAGNHGLSVAAGAQAFGARSVVYIARTVPESFADRLRAQGAEVVRQGETYEASMEAAAAAAKANGWTLLSDSSWAGYTERPHRLMEGYLVLMAEAVQQMPQAPTHIFLQAGVGGLAGAAAALARARWGDGPVIVVVEPEAAAAIYDSIRAGAPVVSTGPISAMGRLDCKEPSLVALKGLARDADFCVLITENEGTAGADMAAGLGLESTPSGAAGLSGLLASARHRGQMGLSGQSRVLLILSEGPEA